MSKGLEALERLGDNYSSVDTNNTIKDDYYEDYEIIEKELKALEIIKTTIQFEIAYFKEDDTWTLYIRTSTQREPFLSGSGKEEYELLKEVLL